MAKSLKRANKLPLAAVVTANVVVFVGLVQYGELTLGNWRALLELLPALLPAGASVALMGIFNAQLSADAKARIVFVRWRNPMPGSEAFTRYMHEDQRIDVAAIERQYGPLPTAPKLQNALWYQLYKACEKDPAVNDVHGEYLFSRDYAYFALVMLLAFGATTLFVVDSWGVSAVYVAALLLQYLLVARAARMHAHRFVKTVLAVASAKKK